MYPKINYKSYKIPEFTEITILYKETKRGLRNPALSQFSYVFLISCKYFQETTNTSPLTTSH